MQSVKKKISEIKINPNNPRLIKDENFKKLVQSIKDFPQMLDIRPIVVNADMVVLGGNMRLKACKEAGLKEVPVIVTDFTDEQQKEFLIKDNVSGGEWDWDALTEWDSEKLNEWGLDVPGFGIDPKDKSQEIAEAFKIEIELETEQAQENLYNELISKGFVCRILTL